MTASANLAQADGEKALRLVDDAIAVAINENDIRWAVKLDHHAAIIATFLGKTELSKRYYQESLALSPENPVALYGLAKAAKDEGNWIWEGIRGPMSQGAHRGRGIFEGRSPRIFRNALERLATPR